MGALFAPSFDGRAGASLCARAFGDPTRLMAGVGSEWSVAQRPIAPPVGNAISALTDPVPWDAVGAPGGCQRGTPHSPIGYRRTSDSECDIRILTRNRRTCPAAAPRIDQTHQGCQQPSSCACIHLRCRDGGNHAAWITDRPRPLRGAAPDAAHTVSTWPPTSDRSAAAPARRWPS